MTAERGRPTRQTGTGEATTSSHTDDFEAFVGPFRRIRKGETVRKGDVVIDELRVERVPERIYGGRRHRGPLPDGVPTDRRQS